VLAGTGKLSQRSPQDKQKALLLLLERKKCEDNIQQIMATGDFTTLYTHPKLMGHYYWKDDMLQTRK
jgi:hypothetical protein